jgi:hypothetical protein
MPWVKTLDDMWLGFHLDRNTKVFKLLGKQQREPEVKAINPRNPMLVEMDIEEGIKNMLFICLEEKWAKAKDVSEAYDPLEMSKLSDYLQDMCGNGVYPHMRVLMGDEVLVPSK